MPHSVKTPYLNRTIFLCLLLIGQSSLNISAQTYPFDLYTSKDGLLMDYVFALCSDSRGYLWVGTNDGVSVYDGEVFRNYTVADGLAYSRVNCITESRRHPGTVWIGTNGGGVSKWEKNRFESYRVGSSHFSNIVSSIFEDRDGILWCGTADGLFRLEDNTFTLYTMSKNSNPVADIAQSADGALWAIMSDNIWLLGFGSKSMTLADIHRKPGVVPMCIHAAGDTSLWIGMSDGELIQLRSGHIVRRVAIEHSSVNFILDDGDDFLIGTTNGVYTVPQKRGKPVHFCSTVNGLPENDVSAGAIDHEGDMWFGLNGKGIAKLTNRSIFSIPAKDLLFAPNNSAASIDSNEHLWVPSTAGLWEFWKGGKYSWHSKLHDELKVFTGQGPFTVMYDPPSRLWVGCIGGDILCFTVLPGNKGASTLEVLHRWRPGKEFRAGGAPLFFFKDREGYYWCSVSENRGVYLFNPVREKPLIRVFTSDEGMPDNSVRAMIEDRDGNFWFGGYDNGLTFLPAKKKFLGGGRRFTAEDGLPNMSIRSILQDSAGVIWVGTRYGGIAYFHDSTFHPLSLKDGLLSTAVWSMMSDAPGHQWLGTQLGFQEMTTKGSIKLISKKELSGPPVYACGAMKDRTLWLITDAGITFYDRRNDLQSDVPPPIYISRVLVSGVEVNTDSSHEFAYDQNNFSIEVIGLSLKDEKAVQYQYKLVGVDTGWSVQTRNHLIVFAALSPGTYTFMARAINGSGIVSAQPATFSFTIAPALWRQWWFIALCVLLVIAVFFVCTAIACETITRNRANQIPHCGRPARRDWCRPDTDRNTLVRY